MNCPVIENPILNSPYEEPSRHFLFTEEGITDRIIEGRRPSSYFVPVPKPKGRLTKDIVPEWTGDRLKTNEFVNQVRERVGQWRRAGRPHVTRTTARLLQYWTDPDREKRFFFCQIEAMETAIYLTEVARKEGAGWIDTTLREENAKANPLLFRISFKMATGTGKTVVMAMLIAWHTLNKIADPKNDLFSDAFLIVAPGITIKDRLRVLLPNDVENYYRKRDVVPSSLMDGLGRAKVLITNYHAFKPRDLTDAGRLTKAILKRGAGENGFKESPDRMVRRVLRGLGAKRRIVVINDEAHHCYRRRPDGEEETLTGADRKDAKKRNEEARIWISGLEAVRAKIGTRAVYDLSATPFFLKGSGYSEGTPFSWVVSDFSLVDAIESGVVKVPRVPVADDSVTGGGPTYRNLWVRIKDDLPKKGRKTEAVTGEPKLPVELEGALQSLYGNYERFYRQWEADEGALERGSTPPVFIAVCNNTNVSKLVFDYIAGWEKTRTVPKLSADGSPVRNKKTGEPEYERVVEAVIPGRLPIFSNVNLNAWTRRPNTLLVDSEQLESGEGMSDEFKTVAIREIEEFKAEHRTRFPDRDPEKLTDEDLLREVMNTVGKPGKLGERIKCVVSVSMLTEGWDANTVTHILGVRAFGTQLLCEQVVGRGLRRMSYALNDLGHFDPEYAEVYGVPFSFIPSPGSSKPPDPGDKPVRVRALEERITHEIVFPRLQGYRYDFPEEGITAVFGEHALFTLSTQELPTKTEMQSILGDSEIHDLAKLRKERPRTVAFHIAAFVLTKYFRGADGEHAQHWLFPKIVRIAEDWMAQCVTLKDDAFPQLLLLAENAHAAADRIYRSIVDSARGEKKLKPILKPYDVEGSTKYVDFDTRRPTYAVSPDKCHVSHVVADTDSWEQKTAQILESMDEVVAYVKNHNLGFVIPYAHQGEERQYIPDFLVKYRDGRENDLNLIIEVTGERKKDKEDKVATARSLWVPAVNNSGRFGRWAFIEITDPWNAATSIRDFVNTLEV